MRNPAETIKDAVDELVSEYQGRQFSSDVTVADALAHVDPDLVIAWAAIEMGKRSPQSMLAEAFEELTDADAKTVFACLLNDTDTARKILAECLRNYVAKDLVYEANKAIENWEPSDAQVEHYFDPTAGDRRAIAREQAAYHRRGLEWPL